MKMDKVKGLELLKGKAVSAESQARRELVSKKEAYHQFKGFREALEATEQVDLDESWNVYSVFFDALSGSPDDMKQAKKTLRGWRR